MIMCVCVAVYISIFVRGLRGGATWTELDVEWLRK